MQVAIGGMSTHMKLHRPELQPKMLLAKRGTYCFNVQYRVAASLMSKNGGDGVVTRDATSVWHSLRPKNKDSYSPMKVVKFATLMSLS